MSVERFLHIWGSRSYKMVVLKVASHNLKKPFELTFLEARRHCCHEQHTNIPQIMHVSRHRNVISISRVQPSVQP
jgi:hypothetical protein